MGLMRPGGCDVTLKQLLYFVRIAEAGSINQAAKRLGVAQSAVTRQLQILEVGLGSALFSRGKSGVQLTEQGVAFLPYAREVSQLLEAAVREVSGASRAEATQMSVDKPFLRSAGRTISDGRQHG